MSLSFGNTAAHPSSPYFSRLKGGYIETTHLPSAASTQYNVGDVLFWNAAGNSGAGCLALASQIAYDTSTLQTQTDGKPVFAGICMDTKSSLDTTTRPLLIATKGTAAYPCAAVNTLYGPGTLVGLGMDGTSNLFDQQVVVATNISGAIGKTVSVAPANATELNFYFQSSLVFGQLAA